MNDRIFALYGIDDLTLSCTCQDGASCTSPGKHPIRSWMSDTLEPKPGENIGFRTGKGLIVIDLDGAAGLKWLKTITPFPKTRCVRTGSGGLHFYFSVESTITVRNSARKIAPGVDVRGDGGYVVAPPSRHASGENYKVLFDYEIASCPDWLLDLVTTGEGGSSSSSSVSSSQANEALSHISRDDRYSQAVAYANAIPAAVEGEGGDTQTFKVAAVGYAFGVDEEVWFQWMAAYYNPKCDPPWSIKDLKKKVVNGYQYNIGHPFGWKLVNDSKLAVLFEDSKKKEGSLNPPLYFVLPDLSDVSIARAYLKNTPRRFLLVDEGLYEYVDNVWTPQSDKYLPRIIQAELAGIDVEVKGKYQNLSLSSNKVNNIANCVRREIKQESLDEFDRRKVPGSISTRDGVISIDEDGKNILTKHSPDRSGMQHFDLSVRNAPKPKKWVELLKKIFDGPECQSKLDFVQEYLGAAFTGNATEYDMALILCGRGGNGKSTFLMLVQRLLFGPTVCSNVTPDRFKDPFSLVHMRKSLWNSAGELPAGHMHNVEELKAVVSGDIVSGRMLHHDMIMFRPKAAQIFAANSLPTVADSSDGFWRRAAVLEFSNKFQGEERRRKLETLCDDERAGIILWALEGLIRLKKRGHFSMPESSQAAANEWKTEASPIHSFVEDCLIEAEGPGETFTYTGAAFQSFVQWFEIYSGGQKPKMFMSSFARKMRAMGYLPSRKANGRGFRIKIKPPDQWSVNQ